MYQGRKRPRPGGVDNSTTASTSSSAWPTWATGVTTAPAGLAAVGASSGGLAAPARYYTSTQPDIEDASHSGGGAAAAGLALFPPPLFTPEELAPTYHHVTGSPSTAAAGASAGAATAAGSGNEAGSCVGVNSDGVDSTAGVQEDSGSSGAGQVQGRVILGCPHYRRACKMRAPCCQRLFTCRLCHDQASDHTVDRQEVKEMLCMRCGTLQPMHR